MEAALERETVAESKEPLTGRGLEMIEKAEFNREGRLSSTVQELSIKPGNGFIWNEWSSSAKRNY